MGNLKNKWVKPGGAFNYTEGVRVRAAVAISKDNILVMSGVSGEIAVVSLAACDTVIECDGRLLVAKHDIPVDGYGVALPWKVVTNYDTTAIIPGPATNVGVYGDWWYVGGAGGGFGGAGTLQRDDSIIGVAIAAGAFPRIMAKTLKVSSGVGIADGAILIAITSPL